MQFIDDDQDQCDHQQLRPLQQGNRLDLQYSVQSGRVHGGNVNRLGTQDGKDKEAITKQALAKD